MGTLKLSLIVHNLRCWPALALFVAIAGNAQERPNILLLVAEDLGPRIGAFGDEVARTPNLDALADRGVRYTNVFTTAGVCAPSRAALITGVHQIAMGAHHMRASNRDYLARPPEAVKAFPELLRRAGYYTFTDAKLDYQFSGFGANSGPFSIWDEEGEAANWDGRKAGQPFFGLVNFPETHESRLRREWTEFGQEQAEQVTDPAEVPVPPYFPEVATVRQGIATHYDNIHLMDARVGLLLGRLREAGLADDTVVIWTTDHGDGLPRGKRDLVDSGIRVPMIVYMPPRFAGQDWLPGAIDPRLVSFVDLAPAILHMAGAPVPDFMVGQDFRYAAHDFVFASRDRIDEVPDRQRAVRSRRYKYIRSWRPELPDGHPLAYRDNIDMVTTMRSMYEHGVLNEAQSLWFEPAGKERLYDLAEDPFELENLVNDPDQEETLIRMRNALDDFLVATVDWGECPEDEMRVKFLDADGSAIETPPPSFEMHGGQLMIIASNGASVEYRVNGGPWRLYIAPVATNAGNFEARAVRYGWRESPIARFAVPAEISVSSEF